MRPININKRAKLGIISVFICSLILVISVFIFNNSDLFKLKAAATPNTFGFAWSEGIGWLNFNSVNCDVNNNGLYEGAVEGAPLNCPGSGAVQPYGVNYDSITKNFSGHAWSEFDTVAGVGQVGWLSFDTTETGICPPAVNCQARFVQDTYTGTSSANGGTGNANGGVGSVIIAP